MVTMHCFVYRAGCLVTSVYGHCSSGVFCEVTVIVSASREVGLSCGRSPAEGNLFSPAPPCCPAETLPSAVLIAVSTSLALMGRRFAHTCANYAHVHIRTSLRTSLLRVMFLPLQGRQLKTGHPVFSTCTVAELGAGPGVACDSIVIPSHSMCLGEDNACVVEEEGVSVLEGVMDEEEVGVVEDVTERKSCVEGGERREGVSVVEGGMEEEVRVERDLTEGSSVRVFCGSHDKCVYCWDGHAGKQLWKTPLHSEVYSTPSPCHLSSDTVGVATTSLPNAACVCACSTSGHVYLLDIRTGHILETLKLPGEVFSSPAVVDNHILVGCRDDYIYCIKCLLK